MMILKLDCVLTCIPRVTAMIKVKFMSFIFLKEQQMNSRHFLNVVQLVSGVRTLCVNEEELEFLSLLQYFIVIMSLSWGLDFLFGQIY